MFYSPTESLKQISSSILPSQSLSSPSAIFIGVFTQPDTYSKQRVGYDDKGSITGNMMNSGDKNED